MASGEEIVEEEQAPTNASEIIDSYTLFEYEVEKNIRGLRKKVEYLSTRSLIG